MIDGSKKRNLQLGFEGTSFQDGTFFYAFSQKIIDFFANRAKNKSFGG